MLRLASQPGEVAATLRNQSFAPLKQYPQR
jgi:hypothetical protein